MSHYNRPWLNSRSPIPACNARALVLLLERGIVAYKPGLDDIQFSNDSGQYIAAIGDKTHTYDYIINASGPSKYPSQDDGLLNHLIKKGHMCQNPWRGVEVDFDRSYIMDSRGKYDNHQYMLGQNTSGVHYYTTSLEMIVNRSDIIAKNMIKSIHTRQ